jgi:hypothetical protein
VEFDRPIIIIANARGGRKRRVAPEENPGQEKEACSVLCRPSKIRWVRAVEASSSLPVVRAQNCILLQLGEKEIVERNWFSLAVWPWPDTKSAQ